MDMYTFIVYIRIRRVYDVHVCVPHTCVYHVHVYQYMCVYTFAVRVCHTPYVVRWNDTHMNTPQYDYTGSPTYDTNTYTNIQIYTHNSRTAMDV